MERQPNLAKGSSCLPDGSHTVIPNHRSGFSFDDAQKLYRMGKGGLVAETVPWLERVPWDQLVVWCLASMILIAMWRSLRKLKADTWSFLVILIVTAFFYLLWGVGLHMNDLGVLGIGLLLGTPLGLVILWRSRNQFTVTPRYYIQVASAIALAAAIILVSGSYFPKGSIEWTVPVPRYVDIIALSGFAYPEEKPLVLCWILYAIVNLLTSALRFGRSKVANGISAV